MKISKYTLLIILTALYFILLSITQAQKQIEKVKDVFTVENINSGLSLLNAISKELKLSGKQIIFPRYGNWLIGYVILNGYWIEKEVSK